MLDLLHIQENLQMAVLLKKESTPDVIWRHALEFLSDSFKKVLVMEEKHRH